MSMRAQIGRCNDRLELLDPGDHHVGTLGVGSAERSRKNRSIGEIDSGDVVAHIVE